MTFLSSKALKQMLKFQGNNRLGLDGSRCFSLNSQANILLSQYFLSYKPCCTSFAGRIGAISTFCKILKDLSHSCSSHEFSSEKQPRCGCPCGSRAAHSKDCADVREKASAPRSSSFTSPSTAHGGSCWISTIYPWAASSLIRLMIRTLGDIFLVSPLLSTALPSALKHPQMSFQHAYEKCSHRDPPRDRFEHSQFCFRGVRSVLCCSHPRCECCGCWEALPTSQRRSPPSPSSQRGGKGPPLLCSTVPSQVSSIALGHHTAGQSGNMFAPCLSPKACEGITLFPPSHIISAPTLPSFNNASPHPHWRTRSLF